MPFAMDLETLSVSENAVVLSIAITHFFVEESPTYDELLERSCFVKFSVAEQTSGKYKREISPETVDWWKKQEKDVKDVSLYPLVSDSLAFDGLTKIKEYVESYPDEKVVFVRGLLDQVVFNHFCKTFKFPPIFPYKNYMEMRTAINLLKDTAKNGYCEVPEFDRSVVKKHDPRHDIAYDILMLLKGT